MILLDADFQAYFMLNYATIWKVPIYSHSKLYLGAMANIQQIYENAVRQYMQEKSILFKKHGFSIEDFDDISFHLLMIFL